MANRFSDGQIRSYGIYVGGRWTPGRSGLSMKSLDAYSCHVWATVPDVSAEDVGDAIQAASVAFVDGPWSRSKVREPKRISQQHVEWAFFMTDPGWRLFNVSENRDDGGPNLGLLTQQQHNGSTHGN